MERLMRKNNISFGIKQFSLHPKEIVLPSVLVCPKILVWSKYSSHVFFFAWLSWLGPLRPFSSPLFPSATGPVELVGLSILLFPFFLSWAYYLSFSPSLLFLSVGPFPSLLFFSCDWASSLPSPCINTVPSQTNNCRIFIWRVTGFEEGLPFPSKGMTFLPSIALCYWKFSVVD